jgi:ABC-type amino acid transport substrate-binding protein
MKIRIIKDRDLDPSPFAFMIPPYEYRFQQYLDASLLTMKNSGKLEEIATHWGIEP